MKKVECPKCNAKWRRGDLVKFHIKNDVTGFIISHVKIEDLLFCPVCFFGPPDDRKSYTANLGRILLKEDDVKTTHVVVLGEFGEYVDVPIENITRQNVELKDVLSSFGQEQDDGSIDDHTSVWGGAGPVCPSERLEAAQDAK